MLRSAALLLLIAAVLLMPCAAHAQKPKAKGPFVASVFPAGGQRGTTVQAAVEGLNLGTIKSVRVSGKGVAGSVEKVVDENHLAVKFVLAPDAETGERDIRFVGENGASNRFRFFVGQFPEVQEVEPNSDKEHAQKLESLPVVVNGQLALMKTVKMGNKETTTAVGGDVDFFRFPAKAGQTLVIQADAQRILPLLGDAVPGWTDLLLTLYDGDGKEIDTVDDYRLKPDPVLFFRVPKDGEYLVSVCDVVYRGRSDFIYRLTIGAIPFVTDVYPLGGKRGTTAKVELSGVNLQKKTLDLALPADAPAKRFIHVTENNLASNAIPFAAGDLPEVEEKEPNDTAEQAMRVEAPVTINGRIQKSGDEDFFVFAAKAKQKLVLEVTARRLGSPLDSVLTLFDAKGQEVAENDDTEDPTEGLATHHADSRIVFTVPADGDYTLQVRDIQEKGGPEYAYRLSIAPAEPDYNLNISPDILLVGPGDTAGITVTAIRKDGFDGEITLQTKDLPKGFVVSDAVIGKGNSAAFLTLTCPAEVPKEIAPPTVVGTATVGEKTVTRKALPAEELLQAFFVNHSVSTQELFMSVADTPRFTVSVELPGGKKVLEVPAGGEATVKVVVKRAAEPEVEAKPGDQGKPRPKKNPNDGKINIGVFNPFRPQPGKPAPKSVVKTEGADIPPDKDQVEVKITVDANAKPDTVENLVLRGEGTYGPDRPIKIAPAIPVRVLGSEPAKPEAKK